ncbi:fungal Zn binuclear cluster domain-containing protein [Colletotrichum truncatum]|uniref:Fungal Zn binuclear cluster domain-containing protein n=1 Tax=Colletotrichum truncatum TaxID=5467 RepID=A0ACC3YD44_COLTU
MKRFGYKKSRDGCTICKQRRVKCDEKRPCGACVRHGVICSLIDGQDAPTAGAQSMRAHPLRERLRLRPSSESSVPKLKRQRSSLMSVPLIPRPSIERVYSPCNPSAEEKRDPCESEAAFPYFARFLVDLDPSASPKDGWILDLELMHHFTSTSYLTFSSSPMVQKVFQSNIPNEAFNHPFLLHQILTFSAYHKAFLQPSQRHIYLPYAAKHQNDAINQMRPALADINSSNCHAIFATSTLLTLSAFATYPSQEKYDPAFSSIPSMLDIFTLTTGMRTIFRTWDQDLRKGPLGDFFSNGFRNTVVRTVDVKLQPLFDQLSYVVYKLMELRLPRFEYDVVNEALLSLIECVTKVSSANTLTAPAEFRALLMWPGSMSKDYLVLLREQHPAALMLLAHFCVVAHMAEPFCWFLEGWAKALMAVITAQICDSPWAEFIKWPQGIVTMNIHRSS